MDEIRVQVRRAAWRLGFQRFLSVLGYCVTGSLALLVVLLVVDHFRPIGVLPRPGDDAAELGFVSRALWVVVALGPWIGGAVGLGCLVAAAWALLSGASRWTPPLWRSTAAAASKSGFLRPWALTPTGNKARPGRPSWPTPGAACSGSTWPAISAFVRRGDCCGPCCRLRRWSSPVRSGGLLPPDVAGAPPDQAQAQEPVKKSSEELLRRLAEQRKQAKKEGLPDAERMLKRLEQGTKEISREPNRKEALVKLHDLKQELQQRRQELGDAQQIRQQLNQFKDFNQGPADKLSRALSRGDFKQAMKDLQQLKDQLSAAKLSEAECKQLEKQLGQMQKALDKLAENHKDAAKQLDKQLGQAKQSGDKARAGKLQQQLDKLLSQMPQMQQLNDLGKKLGECSKCMREGDGKGAAQAMDKLSDQLGQMARESDELQAMDQALADLDQFREQMTCPHCKGAGCAFCQGGDGKGKDGDFLEQECMA